MAANGVQEGRMTEGHKQGEVGAHGAGKRAGGAEQFGVLVHK